jgi:hypothetical protein
MQQGNNGRFEMESMLSKLAVLAGIVLFTACGSQIARLIGNEQWLVAGFAIGLLLCIGAPVLDLRMRVKRLETALSRQSG